MNKKTIGKVLTIASACALLSATIFICLCLFSVEKNNLYLGIALGSSILASLFNIIRRQNSK